MVDEIKSKNAVKKDKLSKTEIAQIENSNISKEQKENEVIAVLRQKRIESMTDEEIIEENLKSILEVKSHEERKANGRLIAVLVAFLVIFLAIYHAWIRKTAVLAGVLVPAAIMLGYGGWVVVLAKRDKRKRAMFKKRIEEVAVKNKSDLEKKAAASSKRKSNEKNSSTVTVHFEDEISNKKGSHNNNKPQKAANAAQIATVQIEDERKHRKRNKIDSRMALTSLMMNEQQQQQHGRRPSIKQKLFGQNLMENRNPDSKIHIGKTNEVVLVHEKRKKLQRMDTLPLPNIVRISSVP